MMEHFCKSNNFLAHVEFSFDHPVEEIGRVLLAVLIKHQGLGTHVLSVVDKCKYIDFPFLELKITIRK